MRKNKKGDAMIMVICIMAVFLALSLAAILSASTLMSGALKSKTREQCRLSAITFSKVLESEITRKTDYEDRRDEVDTSLRSYLRKEMEKKDYYNEDEKGHADLEKLKRKFELKPGADIEGIDENAGNISVAFYWTTEATLFETYKDYSSGKVALEVTCEKNGQKQMIRTWYSISYEAYDADGTKVTAEDLEPSDYENWETEGKILAWKWGVSEVR